MFDAKTYGLATALAETRAALHHTRQAEQGYVARHAWADDDEEGPTHEEFEKMDRALHLLVEVEASLARKL